MRRKLLLKFAKHLNFCKQNLDPDPAPGFRVSMRIRIRNTPLNLLAENKKSRILSQIYSLYTV